MTESVLNEERRQITVLERYSMEILAMAIFAVLSWVGYTTYQNALTLNTISARFENFALLSDRLADRVADNSAELKALEIRVQRIEDTRFTESDHARAYSEFKQWVRDNFKSKVNNDG